MSTHEEKMALARACAITKAPYFADTIQGFIYQPIDDIATMLCTPKMILGYSPAWAIEAEVEVLATDIAHEVNHIRRRHFPRGARVEDPKLWNIAGDLSINPDLKEAGWQFAEGPM